MNDNVRLSLHYAYRAILTGGFAYYIYRLSDAGRLELFIAPRMEPIVKLSAVGLSLIAVYFAFAAFWSLGGSTLSACGCGHAPKRSPARHFIAYSLFAAPLLLGAFVPDAVMGSDVVDRKGIVLDRGTGTADRAASGERSPESADSSAAESLFATEDLFDRQYSAFAESLYAQDPIVIEESSFLEASTAIDLFMHAFQGKRIEIGGFVYKQDGMTETQFVVARLGMDCCSADATPYGFLVEWPDANALSEDTWVRVAGTIGTSPFGDATLVSIRAERVEPIAMPETPYVYPNYEVLE